MTPKSRILISAEFRLSLLVGLTAFALMFFSCGGDGDGGGDSSSSVTPSSSDAFVCPTDEVQLCVGNGTATARLFVEWADGITPDTLVWIYRFNPNDSSQNRGISMIFAVAKADPHFAALVNSTSGNDSLGRPLGTAVGGLGYFFNGVRKLLIESLNITVFADSNGLFIADTTALFDDYEKVNGDSAHWESGWCYGWWSYNVNQDTVAGYTLNTLDTDLFTWAMVGASTRVLVDNSADYWVWGGPLDGCPSYPSSSSNGGDSSSSNGGDSSSSNGDVSSDSNGENLPLNMNLFRRKR